MSSGQVVGSMPTGTFWKVASPAMGGFVSLKTSLKVWVMLGATQETRHLTMCILLKRVRTALTMLAARVLLPVAHDAVEAADLVVGEALHELARVGAELVDAAWSGTRWRSTGTGVLGRTSLFSGKRPLVR